MTRPSLLTRLARAVRGRLTTLEADRPDGPLAGYRWLWRALEKSSGRSRWLLRLRFILAALQDLSLLGAWWALRPWRKAVKSPSVRAILAGAILVAVGITAGRPTHPGAAPATSPSPPPGSRAPRGPAPTPEHTGPAEPTGPTIDHADIVVVPNGRRLRPSATPFLRLPAPSHPRHVERSSVPFSQGTTMPSRRAFIQRSALSAVGLGLPAGVLAGRPTAGTAGNGGITEAPEAPAQARRAAFFDILRPPDAVGVQTEDGDLRLTPAGSGRWSGGQVDVSVTAGSDALGVRLGAPSSAVLRVHLRWRGDLNATRLLLGDAWERGYGDLEWRGFVPDRVMPWYFAAWDGDATHAYGVRTGAAAFCFWQADSGGISLWADVRSGGVGVRLGERTLAVCDVLCRQGGPDESPFTALHTFCRQMCTAPRVPDHPVYGHNDWYWAYGNNSATSVLTDARRIVELSPDGSNRPFAVIDDGWQPARGSAKTGRGLWDRGNEKFPDMAKLAGDVHAAGARPGIWIRPLLAPDDAPDAWRLPRDKGKLDPTAPEVLDKVRTDMARLRTWGFELIKHDYSTFDVFGRWGFQMGATMTKDGWTFAEGPKRTTAEVLNDLYGTIRAGAGDTLVIGCNTVSHLSAGVFDMCRIGDDTSGEEWARTRRMGVNTLAFRGVQQGAFYGVDPDCVGVTTHIPWKDNRQWLDLVARSGTMLFVSIASDALGAEQRRDIRAALAVAAVQQPLGDPSDWQHTTWPARWRLMDAERTYDWIGPDGIVSVP